MPAINRVAQHRNVMKKKSRKSTRQRNNVQNNGSWHNINTFRQIIQELLTTNRHIRVKFVRFNKEKVQVG